MFNAILRAAIAAVTSRILTPFTVVIARMGQAGGSFVAREFNRSLWAARYLSLLSQLPAGGQAPQPVTSPALPLR